jgi:nickel-dependent lactate racemase
MILPGVAGWDTIVQNHCGVLDEVNTLGLADANHMRLDMEEGARMAGLDMKVDVLVDSRARIVDVYAGDFVEEHRAALDRARDIWMTKMEPADIYVLYPGEGSEKYLSSSFFIRIEGAELATKDDGIIIMVLSAAGGWAPQETTVHSMSDASRLFKAGTEEIARTMVRRDANARTCSILFTARRVLERRRVFLVCDGIQPQEAKEFGFEYCTPRFEDALVLALEERGKDARIAVNVASNAIKPPATRPVAWRAMPWREG